MITLHDARLTSQGWQTFVGFTKGSLKLEDVVSALRTMEQPDLKFAVGGEGTAGHFVDTSPVGGSVGVDGTDHFAGELNLSNVVRGAFRSAHIGYWMDEDRAGNGYIPEALVMACRFAFEEIDLHRVQVSIVPRNTRSRRVVEKLEFRCEGLAERYLEIDGVWEDHLRFAMTAEEWCLRRTALAATWLKPSDN